MLRSAGAEQRTLASHAGGPGRADDGAASGMGWTRGRWCAGRRGRRAARRASGRTSRCRRPGAARSPARRGTGPTPVPRRRRRTGQRRTSPGSRCRAPAGPCCAPRRHRSGHAVSPLRLQAGPGHRVAGDRAAAASAAAALGRSRARAAGGARVLREHLRRPGQLVLVLTLVGTRDPKLAALLESYMRSGVEEPPAVALNARIGPRVPHRTRGPCWPGSSTGTATASRRTCRGRRGRTRSGR